MIKIAKSMLLVVAAASTTLGVASPAAAQVDPVADGLLCGFVSEYDPTAENDVQRGEMDGGPLVATAPGATISMKCSIQVGAANVAHNGTDADAESSTPSLQVTSIPPTIIEYSSPEGQPVYLCTEVTVNGIPWYYDDVAGAWSSSSAVSCSEAISQATYPRGGTCPEDAVIHFSCYYTDATGTHYCPLWIGDPLHLLDSHGFCLIGVDPW